jgi:mono/diheme cytochrome c family protein
VSTRVVRRVIGALLLTVACTLGVLLSLSSIWAAADQHAPAVKGPVRITMEASHAAGGVPPGWQFTLPMGDPEAGREVFIALQCYTCHNVAGEHFPEHPPRDVGPDLTGMGAHHPAAYFAESILNPNAVIITEKGYTGPDGLSRMPEYNSSLTIAQLIDLVAYLKSLQEPPPHAQHGTTKPHQHPGQGHQHGSGGQAPPPAR